MLYFYPSLEVDCSLFTEYTYSERKKMRFLLLVNHCYTIVLCYIYIATVIRLLLIYISYIDNLKLINVFHNVSQLFQIKTRNI